MLAPYEITRDGRTYHGNVALKEHRLLERDGEHCLFLVPDMAALPVSAALAKAIAGLRPGFATLLPGALMRALRGCGLVAEPEADAECAGAKADEAGTPSGNEAPAGSHRFPVRSLALFLTQTCNLRCIYCYGEGGEYGGRGMMSEETALAAVDWLLANSFEAKTLHVSFFGGEPLLNFPLLQRVVVYARGEAAAHGKEVKFGMTTNASLLTDEMIAYLAEEKIEPLISFDGPPEIHDRQRPFRNGRGSHARVHANAQKLRAALPHLTGRATVCAGSDPFVVRRGMEEAGFTTCILIPASPVILRESGAADAGAGAGQRETAEQMLAYRRAEAAELLDAVRERRLDAQASPPALMLLAALADGRKRHAACGLGRGMRAVAVNGDVYPCHRFVGLEDARLGHLSDYRAGAVNDYHRAVVENLPACRSCWARYFCGGGCFYDNLARSGDMHSPDPEVCREVKTVCEDVICAWCALSDEDRAYVREQTAKHNTLNAEGTRAAMR
jgi:uncharacterized protein